MQIGNALTIRERQKIVEIYRRNRNRGYKRTINIERVAKRFLHSVVTVRKYVNIWDDTNDYVTWREQSGLVFMGGRRPSYNRRVMRIVKRIIALHSELYLDEIQRIMLRITGIRWSIQVINRIIKKLGLTWKRTSKMGFLFSYEDLALFWTHLRAMRVHKSHIVWADESYVHDRVANRMYGRSPKGKRAFFRYLFAKGTRWGVLAARNYAGVIAYDVIDVSTTAEEFILFVFTVLVPVMGRWPGPNSVLCLDNASYHKSRAFEDMLWSYGIKLTFTPPYGALYDPVELDFNNLKGYIRRHYITARSDPVGTIIDGMDRLQHVDVTHYLESVGYFDHIGNF